MKKLRLLILLLSFILILQGLSFILRNPLIPEVKATTETRYMRNDKWTVNGYNTYELATSQSSGSAKDFHTEGFTNNLMYAGIRVLLRHSDGSENEITSGSAVAVANTNVDAEISATWNCIQTAIVSTDNIEVNVYMDNKTTPTTYLTTFETEQLSSASRLDSNIWTVYYNIKIVFADSLYFPYFYFGNSTYNSRITGFAFCLSTNTNA